MHKISNRYDISLKEQSQRSFVEWVYVAQTRKKGREDLMTEKISWQARVHNLDIP